MKIMVLSLIVTFVGLIANAQSISQLDRNPGYKELKLGTSINSLRPKLSYVYTTSLGGQMHRVIDDSYLTIFGVKMDEVNVFSLNGTVTGILMVKRSLPGAILDSSFQERIKAGLTRLYGRAQFDMTNKYSEPTKDGVAWRTSNKEAYVCTFYFSEKELYALTVFWGTFGEKGHE